MREVLGAARVPVVARVNGAENRTTIVKMRGECVIPVRRQIREQASVARLNRPWRAPTGPVSDTRTYV